jgi:hypothetical protein
VFIQEANLDFLSLLQAVEAAPDVDRDGNGSKESWTFALSFATIPVWLF